MGSHVRNLAKVGAEMMDDLAQFGGRFDDKAGVQFSTTLAYQLFDLGVQGFDFLDIKRNFVLSFLTPSVRPIEGTRRKISRQKRNGIQSSFFCTSNRCTK